VAAVAIRVCCGEGVIVPHVAIGAGHNFARRLQLVRAGQRPAGCAVIEDRRVPRDGVMASGAIRGGERCSRGWVRRIVCRLPGGQVALRIPAVRRRDRQGVIVIDVAGRAGRYFAPVRDKLVRIRQRESCRCMIEG